MFLGLLAMGRMWGRRATLLVAEIVWLHVRLQSSYSDPKYHGFSKNADHILVAKWIINFVRG